LKAPQWELAQSTEAGALYNALAKRFPNSPKESENPWGSRNSAAMFRLIALVLEGRVAEAKAFGLKSLNGDFHYYMPEDVAYQVEREGGAEAMRDVLGALLEKKPDLPLWDQYIRLAVMTKQTEPMIVFMRKVAANPKLSAAARMSVGTSLYKALLAADRVDEGVAAIQKLLKQRAKPDEEYTLTTAATTLAKLGNLLGKAEWTEEGVKAAKASVARDKNGFSSSSVVDLLLDLGRPAEAEAMAAQAVARSMADPSGMAGFNSEPLVVLAGVYHRTNRPQDVLTLLDEAEQWKATDLVEIYASKDGQDTPLGFMAASALAKVGRREEALRIVEAVLRKVGDFDPAYELLIEVQGANALPLLEALHERDHFEERPLIWKAAVLLKEGRTDEAAAVARQAIAVDPSDGGQKFGRRMRVYGILADALERKGDTAQANTFREAVKAIRISEEGDKFVEAGLVQRGIKLYDEALRHFDDAYCIQSRLAVQLAEQGREQEAAEHYRRAYELMPSSFGRVETHCFGCEGVFRGRTAQKVAEEVFIGMVKKDPTRPQLHYLLGYLRENQGRSAEALKHYQKAVELDPDYLNAWSRILILGHSVTVPRKLREATILQQLRLDPLGRHGRHDTSIVTDLKALWRVAERAEKEAAVPASLYPLKASAVALQHKPTDEMESWGMATARREMMDDTAPSHPGAFVAQNGVVQALISIFDISMQMGDEFPDAAGVSVSAGH
jgi:tetratricopeptide (TPR) repeat protein